MFDDIVIEYFWQEIITLTHTIWHVSHKFHLYLILAKK